MPFDGNKNIKTSHPVYLNSEERRISYRDTLFSVATLEKAKELAVKVLQEVKGFLEAWMSDIERIMGWESTHIEYDSSQVQVGEKADEKTE